MTLLCKQPNLLHIYLAINQKELQIKQETVLPIWSFRVPYKMNSSTLACMTNVTGFIYNKQLYFTKTICWLHIWSYRNTNLLNICVVVFFLHILCYISSLNTYKK